MITDVNPFVYSHPVSAEEVIDRDGETKELLTNAVGGHFVRLYAPRKYGKTSLLKRALRDGEDGNRGARHDGGLHTRVLEPVQLDDHRPAVR